MRRARGFTLVEAVVALTILSMIMVATIATLRAFGNTNITVKRVTERVDEVRVVSAFLRNTIGNAMPVSRVGAVDEDADEAADSGTYFWGAPTEMIWVSPLVLGASSGGTYLLRMALVDGRVELRWHSYEPSVEAFSWDELEPRVLLEEVEEFELDYLPDYGEEWVREWVGPESMPVSVRVNIKARDRYWPELVVRLDARDA